MKLPNAANAIIEEVKLAQYLLNVNHRRGASKARLLNSLGYTAKKTGNAWTTISASNISRPMSSSGALLSGDNATM